MLSEWTVRFGMRLIRAVFRVDLEAARTVHRGGEFDTAVRLFENAWRDTAALATWAVLWAASFALWQIGSYQVRQLSVPAGRALADLGAGVVAFALVPFCLFLLRMGIALSAAARETQLARARVEGAIRAGAMPPPHAAGPGARLVVFLTTPRDFDFVIAAAVAIAVLALLVNHAHADGYPL